MSTKIVLFFEDSTGYGWTETFYYNGIINPNGINADITQLVQARAGILTSTCSILRIRAQTATKRLVTLIQIGGGGGVPGGEMPPTMPSEVALLLDLSANPVGYNRAFLRGVPERVIQADSYIPDAAFIAEANNLLNVVTNLKWNAQGTLGSPVTQYPFAANSFLPVSPRGFQALNTTLAAAVGDKVRIHSTKVPGYAGIKTVTAVSPTTPGLYTFGGAAPGAADPSTNAYATKIVRFDAPITNAFISGATRRGAGRPFGVSRGRRSTLYSLRQ